MKKTPAYRRKVSPVDRVVAFAEFCAKVNKLNRLAADKINNSVPPPLFSASASPLSPNQLRYYYDKGMTPRAAYKVISQEEYIPCA